MKNLIFFILFLLIVSCENLLYEEDDSIGIIDNNEELNEAINGIYGLLEKVYNYNNYFVTYVKADDINLYPNISASFGGDSCLYLISDGNWDEALIHKTLYINLYNTIISANNLIIQLEDGDNSNFENTCLGEAYFIRSVCYFYLIRLFGEIPVVRDIDVKYNIKRSSIPEVYDFIENDMLNAIKYLPPDFESVRIPYVTPHQGTAKAVLAEIYLTMAGNPLKDANKYSLAAKTAEEVINNAACYGFELINDYAELWNGDNINNKERLFGLNFEDDGYIRPFFSGTSGTNDITMYKVYIINGIIPEVNFYNAFPGNYRKKATFYMGYYEMKKYIVENETYEWLELAELDPADYCSFIDFIRYRKWIQNDNYNVVGIYLYRYAHTLLTYAEAKARSNQLDQSAYDAVNMVRRRANKLDINEPSIYDLQQGLSPEQFADSVMWERAWEFCIEPEGRWFDIIRLEMLEEIHEMKYNKEPEVPWFSTNYFLPIPKEDIWLNPNLEDSVENEINN